MSLYFQNREWSREELEAALKDRSNQARKIMYLVRDIDKLELKIKQLEKENFELNEKVDTIKEVLTHDDSSYS